MKRKKKKRKREKCYERNYSFFLYEKKKNSYFDLSSKKYKILKIILSTLE